MRKIDTTNSKKASPAGEAFVISRTLVQKIS